MAPFSASLVVLALSMFPRQSAGFQPRSWVHSPTAPRTAPRVVRHVEIGESVSTQGEGGGPTGAGREPHGGRCSSGHGLATPRSHAGPTPRYGLTGRTRLDGAFPQQTIYISIALYYTIR